MTDAEIESRLQGLKEIRTLDQDVKNEIVRVESDRVVVRSSRTGNDRPIRYSTLRAKKRPPNSRIVKALVTMLGMPCHW